MKIKIALYCKCFSKIVTKYFLCHQKNHWWGITDELEYCNNSFHSSCTSSVDSGVWKKSTLVCDPYANLAKSSCGLLLVELPHKIENKNLDS